MRFKLLLPRAIRKIQEPSCISIERNDNFELYSSLKEILKDRFDLIFNEDGSCKGFVKFFHNDKCIDNLHEIKISNDDELEIITSMSGG